MDRHSLRNSLFSLRSLLYTLTIFLWFSLTLAAPSTSPFDFEPSLRLERRTEDAESSTPSYRPSSTRGGSVASPTPAADDGYVAPIPRAFDTSVDMSNFTETCQPFFRNFLGNETFINCLPLSFFVQNSKSWFDITKHGIVPVTQALTASCSVDSVMCNAVMNELGRSMLEMSNCGQDFKNRNAVVVQAFASFISYPVMFAAGCQRSETGFCYADAITNSSNAADTYIYLMPVGVPIPGGARLTCSTCLEKTMKIFAAAASNSSLPISSTYAAGANLINLGCGPGFVNTTISNAQLGSGVSLSSMTWISTVSIIAILSMAFL